MDNPTEKEQKFVDDLHRTLSCCLFYDGLKKPLLPPGVTLFPGITLTPPVVVTPPPEEEIPFKSCCSKLEDDKCIVKNAFKSTCQESYESIVHHYKIMSLVIISFAIVVQVLLLFSFYKYAGN